MVLNADILAALMEDGVLRQGQGGFAVHPELHCFSFSAQEIAQQLSQPESLSRSGCGSSDVLRFATGQSHHLLLEWLPADQTLAEEEQSAAGALAHVDVTSEVAVAVLDEVLRTGTPRVVQAVVGGALNVAEYPLDSLLMQQPDAEARAQHEVVEACWGLVQVTEEQQPYWSYQQQSHWSHQQQSKKLTA